MKYETFEEQCRIEHNSRIQRESRERQLKEVRGEYVYLDFCVWCNCYAEQETKQNEKAFAEWLKRENRTLTEYQRRWIAENHFGWRFTWNKQKNKWEIKKV